MIVDVHTHRWLYPQHISERVAEQTRALLGSSFKLSISEEEHLSALQHVDKAVVLAFMAPWSGFEVPNEFVGEYVQRHRDKLIGFASVDPNEESPEATLEDAVKEWGLKGVKLAPAYQNFDPTSPALAPLYRKIAELRLPILWHQGATAYHCAPFKYIRPLLLDEVAREFPGTPMIIAHFGQPWVEDSIALARTHANVFLDTSGFTSGEHGRRRWQFLNAMTLAREFGVLPKVLLASDFPFATPDETIGALQSLTETLLPWGEPVLEDSDLKGIVQRNALELVGIRT